MPVTLARYPRELLNTEEKMSTLNLPQGLVEEIYECAGSADESHWQHVYRKLETAMSSGSGCINYTIHGQNRVVPIATTNPEGFEEELSRNFFAGMPYRDVLVNLRPGEIFLRRRHLSDQAFRRTAAYNGLLKKVGKFHLFSQCLFSNEEFSANITFTRSETLEHFGRDEVNEYREVGTHLQRALGMQIALTMAAGEKRLLSDGWDRMRRAAIFVDEAGRAAFCNAAARAAMKRGDSVKLQRNGEPAFSRQRETRQLRALIGRAFSEGQGGVMAVPRYEKEPLYVSVSPHGEKFGPPGMKKRMVLVLISEPARAGRGAAADLTELFGLTAAEARVACMIAEGGSITEISDQLSVSELTARTHLKRIFGKTGTKRQSALVRLVLSMPNHHYEK